ncbi:unnamed protein product [Paramecium pentaurelia]|uniref:Uncharacterized protein n=1 Tax=Paramecium pentaurelia TaxID=43138 RepID=A0A8S1WSC6_9CILI|nr:unnamed protein product [Paramecium pentaurelia]
MQTNKQIWNLVANKLQSNLYLNLQLQGLYLILNTQEQKLKVVNLKIFQSYFLYVHEFFKYLNLYIKMEERRNFKLVNEQKIQQQDIQSLLKFIRKSIFMDKKIPKINKYFYLGAFLQQIDRLQLQKIFEYFWAVADFILFQNKLNYLSQNDKLPKGIVGRVNELNDEIVACQLNVEVSTYKRMFQLFYDSQSFNLIYDDIKAT